MWPSNRAIDTRTFVRAVISLVLAVVSLTAGFKLEARANDFTDGEQYCSRGELQQGIDAFTRAIDHNPINPKAYNHRGFAHFRLMDFRLAIADYDRALALNPSYALAFNNRGRAYANLREYDRALQDYDRSIALESNNAPFYNYRGFAYFSLNQFDRAIANFNQAIAIDSSFAMAYCNRGRAYSELNQNDRALADLDKSIALDPSRAANFAERALIEKKMRLSRESAQDLAKAMELYPQNGRVQEVKALISQRLDDRSAEDHMAMGQQGGGVSMRDKFLLRQESKNASVNDKSELSQDDDDPAPNTKVALIQPRAGADVKEQSPAVQPSAAADLKEKLATSQPGDNSPIKDKWALVIGISKFAHPEYDLHFAAKDAQDFYNYLINQAHFQKDHVLLLLDDKATKINILNAFGDKWLPNLCQEGDLAVVYVSTHGTPAAEDRGGQNYIVAYDTDANALFATGVNMDELYGQIKGRIMTDRALIIMDTCYSGAGVPGGNKGIVRGANFNAQNLAQGCGHLVITSSRPDERSWESKSQPNGVFTVHLIEALKSNGGNIDIKSAFDKAQRDVEWDVKTNYQQSQTPQWGGEWKGSSLMLSAPATDPRPMPSDAQSFIIGDTHPAPESTPK